MTVTRQSLRFKCSVKDCPWSKDKEIHVPWCLGIPDVEHWADKSTHQHFPKKGMGGRPSGSPVSVLKDARSMRFQVTRGAERYEILEGVCAVCEKPLSDGDDVVDNNPSIAPLTETASGAVTGESPTPSTKPSARGVDASSLPISSRRGMKSPPSEETNRRAVEESRSGAPVSLDLNGAVAESARMPLSPSPKPSRAGKRAEADSVGIEDSSSDREKVAPAALTDEHPNLGALATPKALRGTEALSFSLPTLSSVCCGKCIAAGFTLDVNHDPSIVPESPRIVAILCVTCHDRIDNGDWGNAVVTTIEDGQRIEIYRAWDVHNETLIERIIDVGRLSDGAEGEEYERRSNLAVSGFGGQGTATSPASPENPLAPSLSKEESDGQSDGARIREGLPEGETRGDTATESRADIPVGDDSGSASGSRCSQRQPSDIPLTHEQRVAIAQQIHDTEWNRQWIAGDTGNAWIAELGEEAEQYLSDFGYVQESLANILRVCAAIKPPYRNGNLRYSHHVVVYELPPEDQMLRLTECEAEGWSVAEFRRQVKGTKPKVKRWSLEELVPEVARFLDGRDVYTEALDAFLDWLGEQG